MSREATGVRTDPRLGHISIVAEDGPALVTLADTGGRLDFWHWEGTTLTPDVVRELAQALRAWAERAERRVA